MRATFDGMFPANPESCGPTEVIRYRRDSDDRFEFAAFASPALGLRETAFPLAYSLDFDGHPQLPLTDIAELLLLRPSP